MNVALERDGHGAAVVPLHSLAGALAGRNGTSRLGPIGTLYTRLIQVSGRAGSFSALPVHVWGWRHENVHHLFCRFPGQDRQ